MYHRHVVSKRIFSRVDYAGISQSAMEMVSEATSPQRYKRWVMRKYFARRGGRGWCFFGEKKSDDGRRENVWLFHATSLPIRRHVKTQARRESVPHPKVGNVLPNLVTADTWPRHFRAVEHCSISGADNAEGAPNAEIPSLARPGGTAITSSQKCWAGRMVLPTVDFFIQNAIANCMQSTPCRFRNRVSDEALLGKASEPCELETLTHRFLEG